MVTRWTLCFSAWAFCSSLAGSEWGASAMWAAGIRQDAARGPTAGSGGATMIQKDPRLGPGMGGSAVQLMGYEGAQYFATQPTPQTAVVGSTAVLPCR